MSAAKALLLHVCCAPCSTYSVARFRQDGWDVSGFWFNPNIHPFVEHQNRRLCLEAYSSSIQLPMHWWEDYEMPSFLRAVADHPVKPERCAACYRLRLERTAVIARERGFAAFSTTLLISPYQDHELLRRTGEEVAQAAGVPFVYADLRAGWAQRGRMTRENNLYRQQYCGCLFSEWERYRESARLPKARA